MKDLTKCFHLFVGCALGLAPVYAGQIRYWDGPLFPVQSGKLILNLRCQKNDDLNWTPEILKLTFGLRKKAVVMVVSKTGSSIATLGDLSCFLGECGGNYVSIDLLDIDPQRTDIIGVVPFPFFAEAVERFSPAQTSQQGLPDCSDLFSQISHEYFKEVEPEKSCNIYGLDRNNPNRFLQVATKGFMQENDWVLKKSVSRILVKGTSGTIAGKETVTDSDTNPFQPTLIVTDKDSGKRILWSKSSGICCPAAITLQMSRINSEGSLEFGRAYSSGGQPCD